MQAIQITTGTKIPGDIRPHGPFHAFVPDASGSTVLTVTENVPAMVRGNRDRAIEGTVPTEGPDYRIGLITTHTHNDTEIPTL